LGYVLLPLRGVLLVSFDTLSTKQTAFMYLVGALLALASGKGAETSAPLKYHRKNNQHIRNYS
uniref:hypothetical protein n=1 Tax=Prevotella sp. TaxID=59823 RepID=UPI004029AF78